MTQSTLSQVAVAAVLVVAGLTACFFTSDERFSMGGKGKPVDLVVVLKRGLSVHEYVEFQEKSLTQDGRYHVDGSYTVPAGVQAIMKSKIEERDVVLIAFFPDVTPEERSALERRLLESPFVESIARDTTPEDALAGSEARP